jgi:hypothetical protein
MLLVEPHRRVGRGFPLADAANSCSAARLRATVTKDRMNHAVAIRTDNGVITLVLHKTGLDEGLKLVHRK